LDPGTVGTLSEFLHGRSEGPIIDLSRRMVELLVKDYARKAGLSNWRLVTPHKLRHSFASWWISKGGNLEQLRRILGHNTILTTQIYTHCSVEDIKPEYDRIFPEKRAHRARVVRAGEDPEIKFDFVCAHGGRYHVRINTTIEGAS
jgi:integrase